MNPNFVNLYTQTLESVFQMDVVRIVYARNGATTKQILKFFKKRKIREGIREADVITITAGGNDLRRALRTYYKKKDQAVFKDTIRQSMMNIASMLKEIQKIKSNQDDYYVRLVGLYNPYTQLEFSDKWIKTFNTQLKRFNRKRIMMADIYEDFKEQGRNALAVDGLHPNKLGYAIIAEALDHTGFEPLVSLSGRPYLYQCIEKS